MPSPEVAEPESERVAVEDGLRRRQRSIVESRADARDELIGTVDPSRLRATANVSLAVMRDAQRTVLELAGLHRRLEAAQERLREASRDRRAIEIVRERRFEDWKQAIDRREQAALDELATIRGAKSVRDDHAATLAGNQENP